MTSNGEKKHAYASGYCRFPVVSRILLVFLLLVVSPLSTHAAVPLPPEFSIAVASSGAELVWSSSDGRPIRFGGARPEFRLPDGTILGYPKEKNGRLVLTLTSKEQELLDIGGQDLEVWSAGKRLDSGAPSSSISGAAPGAMATTNVTSTPKVPVNPAARGKYNSTRLSYKLAEIEMNFVEYPFPIEVVAEVTYPKALESGKKSPLVLFLHGRHSTCYKGGPNGDSSIDWPCPSSWKPIPSHQGYRYIADILASQGYVAVSISANGINGQDNGASDYGASARSILIRHHLALWAQWNAAGGDPWSGLFQGKLDMNNVVLVGHSRGGEGVNRAAVDATITDPYKIVGLVSYGPTAFGQQVTPDIHSATILPTCDGDVSDLQGQAYIDLSRDVAYSPALRSAVIALGTNHNYYNTEWTPGLAKAPAWDDWYDDSDPVCGNIGGSLRLTPREQQVVGAAYTVALVQLAVKQESNVLPLLDGSFVRPTAIGRAEVAVHAVGGAGYRLLYRPESAGKPALSNGMSGRECLGYSASDGSSTTPTCRGYNSPHWLTGTFVNTRPAPQAMELLWTSSAGATARFSVASIHKDLSLHDSIDIRIANDPDRASGARFKLLVRDNTGKNASLLTLLPAVDGWPGSYGLDRVHARTLRGSLASVKSVVDLKNIVDVLLVAQSQSGKVWVLDVAASQGRIETPVVLNLPVLSVGTNTVPEGNGFRTGNLKIMSDRPLSTTGSIWVQESYDYGYKLDLVPGTTNVAGEIPFSWTGDRIYSQYSDLSKYVVIGSLTGALTGNFIGSLTVVEDDPPPILSLVSNTATAVEGKSLEWKFKLSAATTGFSLYCYAVPLVGRTELTSRDVPTSWLRASSYTDPPAVPTKLSSLQVSVNIRFDYGVKTASLVVPIASDSVGEGDEWVAFQCIDSGDAVGTNVMLFGKVPSHS